MFDPQYNHIDCKTIYTSDSSVGRAGDCSRWTATNQFSPSHWFDSGSEDASFRGINWSSSSVG